MMDLYQLKDLDLSALAGRPVLVRVDFNVPLEGGEVADDTRLQEALPTLRELLAAGTHPVLISHCGRPKGTPDPEASLRPVAEALATLLGEPVAFAEDCVGPAAEAAARSLGEGGARLALLENLRFHPGERANDPEFAQALARLGKAYVDDAFGTAHRAHASTVGIPEILETKAAGRLLVREVEALGRLLESPVRPFAAILGGAKISGKIETLQNLLPRLDRLVVGGGMANTFLAARGVAMGASLVEEDRIDTAREILARAEELSIEVHLPRDLVVTDDLKSPKVVETVPISDDATGGVGEGRMAVDIGPESQRAFAEALAGAKTLFWNGPMGVFEMPPFDQGTSALAEALASVDGYQVLGGGETVAAAKRAGVEDRIDHISTGGGASLELLAGKTLPGVAALERS